MVITDDYVHIESATGEKVVADRLAVEKLVSIPVLGGPAVSPDGRRFVYTRASFCPRRKHYSQSLWWGSTAVQPLEPSIAATEDAPILPTSNSDDAVLVETEESASSNANLAGNLPAGHRTYSLTDAANGVRDSDPFWLDAETVGFLSTRGNGLQQVWQVQVPPLDACGRPMLVSKAETPSQLTHFRVSVTTARYSTVGRRLVVAVRTSADGQIDGVRSVGEASNGLRFDRLPVRLWNRLVDERRHCLFSMLLKHTQEFGFKVDGAAVNLMPGGMLECPIEPMCSVDDFTISPDGTEVAFVARLLRPDTAWRPQVNLYVVPVDGSCAPCSVNDPRLGACSAPAYAPNGCCLAWLQRTGRGHTSDRNRITMVERFPRRSFPDCYGGGLKVPGAAGLYQLSLSTAISTIDHWDRCPYTLAWSTDSRYFYVIAADLGRKRVFCVKAVERGSVDRITFAGSCSGLAVLDAHRLLLVHSQMHCPPELHVIQLRHFVVHPTDAAETIAECVDELMLASTLVSAAHPIMAPITCHGGDPTVLRMSHAQSFWFTGANDRRVHGWLLRPIEFDAQRKYPVALVIHGGPESAWYDEFGVSWNLNLLTAAGFAVVAINPHGSVGYGQAFVDGVHGRWGSWPYEDLMRGLDTALHHFSFLDGMRVCGIGASFGGYMVNWLHGRTDRFCCLVSVSGVFDTSMIYYTLDELFIGEHEMGGTPWSNPQLFAKWSPSNHIHKWKTPTLVVHGGKDYRVDPSNGFATFTALQRRNIPSRLLYFPDEGHIFINPLTIIQFIREMHTWLHEHTQLSGTPTESQAEFHLEQAPTEAEH